MPESNGESTKAPHSIGPVASMTGFARAEGAVGDTSWTIEVRSVNNKALDIRLRMPNGYEALDVDIRKAISSRIRRGSVQLSLNISRQDRASGLRVNRELLGQVLDIGAELSDAGKAELPRLDVLLGVRGVIETVEHEPAEDEQAALLADIRSGVDGAIERLADMRAGEGQKMATVLQDQLSQIEELTAAAGQNAEMRPEAIKTRLRTLVDEVLSDEKRLNSDRLEQELAILLVKADIREELDRLRAHIESSRELLAKGGAIGRKLDFLCQEFNREANTLCSKAGAIDLTRIGMDLKVVIDQMREQVQNVE